MKLIRLILIGWLASMASEIIAQENHFRYDLLYSRNLFAEQKNGVGFSLGYDRETTSRTMWGIMAYTTYRTLLSSLEEIADEEVFSSGVSSNGEYYYSHSVFGLVLHSDYAFSDIDNFHFFFGPTTGLIRVGYKEQFVDNFNFYPDVFYETKESSLIVPLGLRLGFRLPGMFSFYGGAGLNFGNRTFEGYPELNGNGAEIRRTYFEFGIAGIL